MQQTTKQPSHDPGQLPRKPAPRLGEKIVIQVSGLPPFKEVRCSLRNPRHRHYGRFVKLRKAATKAMAGRKWSDGAIALTLTMSAPSFEKGKSLTDYLAGVFDTLGGSHGFQFTYLPIVFQDDSQVCQSRCCFRSSPTTNYVIEVEFLASSRLGNW